MKQKADAELEFRRITASAPDDLLSAAQLGFLYLAPQRKSRRHATAGRVLKGSDEELANRVRIALNLPHELKAPTDVRRRRSALMAERSMKAGYLKDALKYLQIAQEADPVDFNVMLKLGWTLQHAARRPQRAPLVRLGAP